MINGNIWHVVSTQPGMITVGKKSAVNFYTFDLNLM